jgi:hypothetical protein
VTAWGYFWIFLRGEKLGATLFQGGNGCSPMLFDVDVKGFTLKALLKANRRDKTISIKEKKRSCAE